MKKIIFVTSNSRKLAEANAACKDFDIEVEQVEIDIHEIQSHDPIEIARHKAQEAFKIVNKPLVVTDTSWTIPALNNFPGGYMKDIAQWFTPQDFINLMKSKKDRRISFSENIIYADSNQIKVFSKEYWGKISTKPRGSGKSSIELVAEFEGHTIGERHDQNRLAYEPKDYIWYSFASWYNRN